MQSNNDAYNVSNLNLKNINDEATKNGVAALNQQSFKETNADVLRLQAMIKEEGLEYVEEIRLNQDMTSLYTGYLDIDGKRKGHGVKIFKNGDKYEGEWEHDKANGKGKFWHADGDFYEGFWKDDKAHGTGLYTSANGSSYLGEWQNDMQHGAGKETWTDKSYFMG